MSALPPKADIRPRHWEVRFVPKADIAPLHRVCIPEANQGGISCSDLRERYPALQELPSQLLALVEKWMHLKAISPCRSLVSDQADGSLR